MSKAILVIDLPDGYGEITDNKATVNLRNWKLDTSLIVCNVPLKPMPKKREYWSVADDTKRYRDGWNACIDEILGEQDENNVHIDNSSADGS